MVKKNSRDIAAEFQPEEFHPGRVVEGSRASEQGIPGGEESEGTNLSNAENAETPERSKEEIIQSKEEGEDDELTDATNPTKPPTLRNPNFESISDSDPSLNKEFFHWVVSGELQGDGTYNVLVDDDGSYEPTTDPEDIPPEQIRAEIVAEARAEAEEIKSDAKKKGFEEGYSKGQETAREEMHSEMRTVFEELKDSIQAVIKFREEILLQSEREIVELVLLFSKKVLHRELHLHPEAILDVVRHALDRAVGWGEATIQVNPEDYEFLEKNRILINEEGEGVNIARIDTNPSLRRGGCLLESNFGEIDVRIDRQIELVEKSLRDALADRLESMDAVGDEATRPEGAASAVSGHAASEKEGIQPEEGDIPEQDPGDIKPYQPMDLGGESGGGAPEGEDAP